jgi:hypothetical protein
VNEEIYKEANEVVNKEIKKDVNEKGKDGMNFIRHGFTKFCRPTYEFCLLTVRALCAPRILLFRFCNYK